MIVVEQGQVKSENSSPPVTVRVSETHELKLPNNLNIQSSYLTSHLFIKDVRANCFCASLPAHANPHATSCNLVPRAYDPSGLRQESRSLEATILITKEITEFCPYGLTKSSSMAHAPNGCSQSSRFLPQARRIVGSGDENARHASSER